MSRMNPSDPKRQKTAARKTSNELAGKVLQVRDQRNPPMPGEMAENGNAAPEQRQSADSFDNRSGNDSRLMKPAEGKSRVLHGAKKEKGAV